MAQHRTFDLVGIRRADEGPTQRGARIACAAPECGASTVLVHTSEQKIVPAEMVAKRLAKRGWLIGTHPKDDRCPACAVKMAAARRPTLQLVKPEPATMAETDPAASAPRQMTRDDRRVIFSKLEEVYLDEATGYDRGWSDKRVAEDLGIPRAWVEEIRDQNFGPARDNDDVRDFLAAQKAIADEVHALKAAAEDLMKRSRDLEVRLGGLAKSADQIRKAVS